MRPRLGLLTAACRRGGAVRLRLVAGALGCTDKGGQCMHLGMWLCCRGMWLWEPLPHVCGDDEKVCGVKK